MSPRVSRFSTCSNSFLAILNRSKLISDGLESKFSCKIFISFSTLSLKAVNCFFLLIQYGIDADLILSFVSSQTSRFICILV